VLAELRRLVYYHAAHFDVLNAEPCLENFGAWPYDRRTDADYCNSMFAEFSAHNRVVDFRFSV
jgi:hypothetical protein